jgi:predicted phosphate transport protein (TIGR00153 family)
LHGCATKKDSKPFTDLCKGIVYEDGKGDHMGMLFGKAKNIEANINQFLDAIAEAGLIFSAGISDYLNKDFKQFKRRIEDIKKHEGIADNLRREVRYYLYTKMLIPESRGDVLGLLETSDDVIDTTKTVLTYFDIEHPDIPEFLNKDLLKLTEASVKALSNLVMANRAFFNNNATIRDFIHKVHFYEHEADQIEEQLKRSIFDSPDIPELAVKLQLRDFVSHISNLADDAEDVAERLSVYSIKRSI